MARVNKCSPAEERGGGLGIAWRKRERLPRKNRIRIMISRVRRDPPGKGGDQVRAVQAERPARAKAPRQVLAHSGVARTHLEV